MAGWPERERLRAAAAKLHHATRTALRDVDWAAADVPLDLVPIRADFARVQERLAAVEAITAGGAA
jgi:hypothetical protein